MSASRSSEVPAELVGVVERHGRAVAAGDHDTVLADFRPDRVGQLVASARPPALLERAELVSLEPGPGEMYTACIRYLGADGDEAVFRSRWLRLEGAWKVTQVRNIPDTPPRTPGEHPSDDGLDAPHWAGLREGELRIQHCPSCGNWIWAPRPICPECHHRDLDWPAVEPAGVVYSWTRTWQPFHPSLTGHLPYVVVNVELPAAGGRRVLGVLLDGDAAQVRIGMEVKGEFDPPDDEQGYPLIRWRLT